MSTSISHTPSRLPGAVQGFPDLLNLRDLGGLPAADGRHVRPGVLYRSGALADLDSSLRPRIDALGLRFMLDLRAAGEAAGRDDYVPDGVEYVRVGGMYDSHGEEVDFSPAGIARMAADIERQGDLFMRSLYVSMMFDNPALRILMDNFVARRVPMLFHCTAGKDRTGVCTALLLMTLGVPDDEIVREYLLTNEYRAEIINMPDEEIPPEITGDQRARWASINGVSADDLRASLAAVDARYPSRGEYLRDQFGLGADEVAALRAWYLA